MRELIRYKALRRYMQSGDLIEWGSASIVGGIIRFFTKKEVNHSSILLNLDSFEGLKERRFILEALEHGVELNLMSKRLKDFEGSVFWSPLKPEYNHLRNGIAAWALERVGIDYDYSSLFSNIFGKVSQDAKKFFCSEYYHMAMVAAGILPKAKAARPGEFDKFDIHSKTIEIINQESTLEEKTRST
ncbi:hypothetical protein KAR91_87185 [Candidatus Pacearchaeota archaeon]|nr:hypothetical protein [Candidatus Pacearchaeota archaeon]